MLGQIRERLEKLKCRTRIAIAQTLFQFRACPAQLVFDAEFAWCMHSLDATYTGTGEKWHISSFNAQPEAPACPGPVIKKAGASGWASNEDCRETATSSGHSPERSVVHYNGTNWLTCYWTFSK